MDATMADEPVRVDKWLWAARFLKTRQLAHDAVKGGRVHVGGRAVKPSYAVKVGDRVELSSGEVRRTVTVLQTAERRVSAKVAATLYEETPESIAAREEHAAVKRIEHALRPKYDDGAGRPTKRDRRAMERLRGRDVPQ